MRINKTFAVALLALAVTGAQAATKDFNVHYRQAIQEDDRFFHRDRHQNYGFRVEIISDEAGVKSESSRDGLPFVNAAQGERYSVRIYNPLPVRVAVDLTVDGLNSITGKPSGIADGQKWMIDPHSCVTIPGWQVSGGEARRFFFTDKPKSYAKWRGDMTGKDLSANCGVIGAAYFWNQQELDQYFDSHPLYRYTYRHEDYLDRAKKTSKAYDMAAPAASGALGEEGMRPEAAPQQEAGTGMGEGESHPTYQVAFDYNTGMYDPSQALVIYYDFAKAPKPNPFPDMDYAPVQP